MLACLRCMLVDGFTVWLFYLYVKGRHSFTCNNDKRGMPVFWYRTWRASSWHDGETNNVNTLQFFFEWAQDDVPNLTVSADSPGASLKKPLEKPEFGIPIWKGTDKIDIPAKYNSITFKESLDPPDRGEVAVSTSSSEVNSPAMFYLKDNKMGLYPLIMTRSRGIYS